MYHRRKQSQPVTKPCRQPFSALGCLFVLLLCQSSLVFANNVLIAIQYDPNIQEGVTANGELYDPNSFSAAHYDLNFGTLVMVQDPQTGRGVQVRINDRTHQAGTIFLSPRAFQNLGFSSPNPAQVLIQVVQPGNGQSRPLHQPESFVRTISPTPIGHGQ